MGGERAGGRLGMSIGMSTILVGVGMERRMRMSTMIRRTCDVWFHREVGGRRWPGAIAGSLWMGLDGGQAREQQADARTPVY
jgi:hypothetical protein